MKNIVKHIVFKRVEQIQDDFGYRYYFAIEYENDVNKHFEEFDIVNDNVFCIEVYLPSDDFERETSEESEDRVFKSVAMYYVQALLREIVRNNFAQYRNVVDEVDVVISSSIYEDLPLESSFEPIEVEENFFIEHNYWHIQLHPNDDSWTHERQLLKEKSCVGLSSNNKNTIEDFKNNIKIGDLILVRHGKEPIALTIVIGEAESNEKDELVWFDWKRKVRVLKEYDSSDDSMYPFPSPRGTLKKASNSNTPSYRYIDNLYHQYLGLEYRYNKLQLLSVNIRNYKMFSNFECKFTNDSEKALELVEIIGENGTGKTTILEAITSIIKGKSLNAGQNKLKDDYNVTVVCKYNDKICTIDKSYLGFSNFENLLLYLPAYQDKTDKISDLICEYLRKITIKNNLRPLDAWKSLREDLNDILEPLGSGFVFKKIDEYNNVYFCNRNNDEFNIDKLSTGEKNILVKALYIHLADVDGKVVLVDEPELSLHPKWQRSILGVYRNLAKSHNCQIIVATHSPQLLSEATDESIRILQVKEGKTQCILPNGRVTGQKASDIMLDVMGVESLRSPLIQSYIDDLQEIIEKPDFIKETFEKKIKKLEQYLGNDDIDVSFLKIDAETRGEQK